VKILGRSLVAPEITERPREQSSGGAGRHVACQNRYFVLEYRSRRVVKGDMKTRTGRGRLLLLTIVTTIIFAAAGFAQEKAGKVEIKDEVILVHPGTKLSKADAKALNDVLKTHDKSFYKIETYKDGKVTKTQGTLNNMYLDHRTVADLAHAKSSGQSERAIQLVAPAKPPAGPHARGAPMPVGPHGRAPVPAGPQQPSSPTPAGPHRAAGPHMGSPYSKADQKAADELMERLKPILEKYTHK
jgi:hypothetical protein